jgi:hypothetical protein
MRFELTQQRGFVPVAITNFQIVLFAVVAFEDVQFGDVEDNALSVSGRDSPLAPLPFFRQRTHGERRRGEGRFVVLERSAAFCSC